MYIDTHSMSKEEKSKLKRQITMQKMSYDADLKKIQRKQADFKDELRRFEIERNRIEKYIEENNEESKKLVEKEVFIKEELRRIKKRMIELG